MQITIVTAGTQGDVQPYVALGLGLQRVGHQVRLVAPPRFQSFIQQWSLDFAPLKYIDYSEEEESEEEQDSDNQSVDLSTGFNTELNTDSVTESLSKSFLTAFQNSFWNMLEQVDWVPNPWQIVENYADRLRSPQHNFLHALSQVCQGAEAILFAPHLFPAHDLAEKWNIPCMAACMHPLSRTGTFPHPYAPRQLYLWKTYQAELPLNRLYNQFTYRAFDQLLWRSVQQPINQWRHLTLQLPPVSPWLTPPTRMQQRQIPFLYGYSPVVLPKPSDWSEHLHVTGYWFLDRPANWQPPEDLVAFLAAGSPPIYVGFGSMRTGDPEALTALVLEALAQTGQRGILLKGWAGLQSDELPDSVFLIDSVPHDWLFPQVAAVVHHGGGGTTAAGLRAGIPSIILPFVGDQLFWGYQIAQLGVGPAPIPQRQLTAKRLAAAIQTVLNDRAMQTRAAAMGGHIRAEDGIAQAITVFHHYVKT
jgi:UDP:flavonoid glycosyltransferase YjiC (YdhE family)